MPLSVGTHLGPYEILAPIGAGGMGEVYRARDTNLNRDVAIKVLPTAFSQDPTRMARFEREAQLLAALNHPNIAAIYGIEQGALIMELVEGEDLHGPWPIDTALHYARQIAIALEAAHEKGIVHRDLKPTNIKVTPDGTVKLLDFGLAKATEERSSAVGQSPTMSPTISLAMTEAGAILGTAAYMSPEQARGKTVDKRADIWAFGVILYEILTGTPLFGGGETVTDTLASVVKEAPDWKALPADTPPRIRRLLERCLRKDPKTRLQAIGEARIAIDEPEAELLPSAPASNFRLNALSIGVAVLLVAILALGLFAYFLRPREEVRSYRVSVLPPDKGSFSGSSPPAVSPDGRRLAFVATVEGKTQLWVRDLDSLAARPLPGTEGAIAPFWSPDSRFIAFGAGGKLKKIDSAGGPALALCDAANLRGGSWGGNETIVFTPGAASELYRVPASGGSATQLTSLDRAQGETSHRWPWFLPDGRHFLYTARNNAQEGKTAIFVGDRESTERRRILTAYSNAVYAPPGFLLFVREQTLMAQPFDPGRAQMGGDPFPIAEHVDFIGGSIMGWFSVSQTGVLAYISGGILGNSQLTWFDRGGNPLGTVGPPRAMFVPAISPDGGTVAVDRVDPRTASFDIWLHDLAHTTDTRFTFDPMQDFTPAWSPDGSRVAFISNRNGQWGLYQKPSSNVGKEELLFESPESKRLTDWSRDGRFLIFTQTDPKTDQDIWVFPMTGERKPVPFLQTDFNEGFARLSPDGRWLAYDSNETSRGEVYVHTFPGQEGKWQISTNGGSRPVWSRDGKELFYVAADLKLMAVAVKGGSRFDHGVPKPLFEARLASPFSQFDVSPDGKRFLMASPIETSANPPMTVVTNWPAGIKR